MECWPDFCLSYHLQLFVTVRPFGRVYGTEVCHVEVFFSIYKLFTNLHCAIFYYKYSMYNIQYTGLQLLHGYEVNHASNYLES